MDTLSKTSHPIYAIVLSYDGNHMYAENLLASYNSLIPEIELIFRIPYNRIKPIYLKDKYPNLSLEFIKTPKHIKKTVLRLIEDLMDDSWIYWCIDDKYPVCLEINPILKIMKWVGECHENDIGGVSFARVRRLKSSDYIIPEDKIQIQGGVTLVKRKSFMTQFWMHQYFRVNVIRKAFNSFPDFKFKAKEMDTFLLNTTINSVYKFYVTKVNYAVFCESSSRGLATLSLKRSLIDYKINGVDRMRFSKKDIVIGHINKYCSYRQHILATINRILKIVLKAI